nr:hypothetical protein [Alkalihalobacillus hemicentroti]
MSGTGETPQERKRRGGSPPAPRKASTLERKSTTSSNDPKVIIYDKKRLSQFRERRFECFKLFSPLLRRSSRILSLHLLP